MIYHFRIPTWYKFTLLTLYVLIGTAALGENFSLLALWIKLLVLIILAVFGLWIFLIWKKELVLDIENGVIKFGNKDIKVEDIVDFKIGVFRTVFYTKSGVVKFCYPIEDPDVLGRYLRGERNEII